MSVPPKRNEWLSPSTLFGGLGMLGAIFSTYVNLDGRISKLEERSARLDRLESKIDAIYQQRLAGR